MEFGDTRLLQSLRAHIRPSMSLSHSGSAEPIDADLARFAIGRHRVGSLLYEAVKQNVDAGDPAIMSLSAAYRKNKQVTLAQTAASTQLSKLFDDNAIPHSFLKGRGLAQQIYSDPDVRHSKDIDILIPKAASEAAIRSMNDAGYLYQNYSLKKKTSVTMKRQLADIKKFKDLTYLDPKFSVQIELHQRLFKIEPKRMTPDFIDAVNFANQPEITNPHYCFYLILHGALTMWSRLKWLVDLSLLIRAVSPKVRHEIMQLANIHRCQSAIVASLYFCEEIFPGSLDDDWRTVLGPKDSNEAVKTITSLFRRTLMSSDQDRKNLPAKNPLFFDTTLQIYPNAASTLSVIWNRISSSIMVRS